MNERMGKLVDPAPDKDIIFSSLDHVVTSFHRAPSNPHLLELTSCVVPSTLLPG